MSPPLVSIVTVVFNAAATIEATIRSIIGWPSGTVEYIVIDGGSTDGTIDILKNYEHAISYWVSEPDRGIYDALNKATAVATGSFILTLNAGDTLVKIPEESLRHALANNVDVALFGVQLSNGKVFMSRSAFALRYSNTVHHQSAFYRRSDDIRYDIRYKIYSDYDLNQRLYKRRKKFESYPIIVSFHSLDGVSGHRRNFSEYYQVTLNNFGPVFQALCFINLWLRILWPHLKRPFRKSRTAAIQ
ncbi:MAG TPA: glycosyltransferase family 2 protein [Cyclobacteriaceae bacterium]|nr:glycosyltransferase family 2 protein [Cyclobacteriaceae bacterium]